MGGGVSKRRAAYVEQQLKERQDVAAESAAESTARWAKEDTEVLRQEAAAVVLGRLCRVRFALREVAHLRAAKAYRSATVLQARARGWSSQRGFALVLQAAVIIQAAVRRGWGGYPDTRRRELETRVDGLWVTYPRGGDRLVGAISRWQWWYTQGNLPPRRGGGAAPCRQETLRLSESPEVNSARGQKGVYFDVRSQTATLLRVTALTGGGLHGAADVVIYCCEGTSVGKETLQGSWRQVGTGTLAKDKSSEVVLSTPVVVESGGTVGFYVQIAAGVAGKRVFRRDTHEAYVCFASEGELGSADATDGDLAVLRGRYTDTDEQFWGVKEDHGCFTMAGCVSYEVEAVAPFIGSGGANTSSLRPPNVLVKRWWRVVRGAVIHIQAAWRQLLCARRVQLLREQRAATWLQATVRTYNARRKYAFSEKLANIHIFAFLSVSAAAASCR